MNRRAIVFLAALGLLLSSGALASERMTQVQDKEKRRAAFQDAHGIQRRIEAIATQAWVSAAGRKLVPALRKVMNHAFIKKAGGWKEAKAWSDSSPRAGERFLFIWDNLHLQVRARKERQGDWTLELMDGHIDVASLIDLSLRSTRTRNKDGWSSEFSVAFPPASVLGPLEDPSWDPAKDDWPSLPTVTTGERASLISGKDARPERDRFVAFQRELAANPSTEPLPTLLAGEAAQRANAAETHASHIDFAAKVAETVATGPLQQRMTRLLRRIENLKEKDWEKDWSVSIHRRDSDLNQTMVRFDEQTTLTTAQMGEGDRTSLQIELQQGERNAKLIVRPSGKLLGSRITYESKRPTSDGDKTVTVKAAQSAYTLDKDKVNVEVETTVTEPLSAELAATVDKLPPGE
jgi:hypothetical protein